MSYPARPEGLGKYDKVLNNNKFIMGSKKKTRVGVK